jgi:TolB-like protein/DNA-binding winged helix-turn-helix (wHTH) protein/Tfp pilus assembly protein PilF
MSERAKHLYAFGPFHLDPVQRLLFRDGDVVSLTPKALDTLLVLVEHHGQLLTKDELLERVWPGTFVEEATLAKNVSTLRKVLGEAPGGGEYIETHSKRGYRFVAEVREVAQEGGAAPGPADAPDVTLLESALPNQVPQSPAKTWRVSALAVMGLTLLAGALWWSHSRTVAAPANSKIMLAVLPFENLSGDPAQEYFSNGLTEEMITQLGRLNPDRLGVIARASAMQYKDSHKDARQIGAELAADYLLEGSVRREGNRVRISAQLIQVRDQSHQWAEDYDRDLRDILALQTDVAGAIAQQIRLKLTPEEHARLQKARVVNPEAYEDYLKGRFFWNKRVLEGHQKAIEYFQKAVALDPGYAQAYAGLADAYALLGSWANPVMSRREAMDRARAAAEEALTLDESLADAHASLGFVRMHFDWDFAGAEKEFQQAIALNPGYATAHHWYAYDLVALARLDDAIAEVRRAQQADPLSVIISRDVGEMLLFAGRDDEAIVQCRKTLEMDPNFVFAHWVLAWAHHRKGQMNEFREELGKSRSGGTGAAEGIYYILQGRRAEARRTLARIEKNYDSAVDAATVSLYLGEKDRAFALLEKGAEQRLGGLIVMRFTPEWEPIRSDPRFEKLERRVGVLK